MANIANCAGWQAFIWFVHFKPYYIYIYLCVYIYIYVLSFLFKYICLCLYNIQLFKCIIFIYTWNVSMYVYIWKYRLFTIWVYLVQATYIYIRYVALHDFKLHYIQSNYIHRNIQYNAMQCTRAQYNTIYIRTYITYLHTYITTYLDTHIPTYRPSYLHTYIATYLHTYILPSIPYVALRYVTLRCVTLHYVIHCILHTSLNFKYIYIHIFYQCRCSKWRHFRWLWAVSLSWPNSSSVHFPKTSQPVRRVSYWLQAFTLARALQFEAWIHVNWWLIAGIVIFTTFNSSTAIPWKLLTREK